MPTLSGTIAVTDPAGRRHRNVDGSLRVLRGEVAETVVVCGGRWSVEAAPGERLRWLAVRLGERPTSLIDAPAPGHEVHLEARWPATIRVAGTLVVPAAWGLEDFVLRLEGPGGALSLPRSLLTGTAPGIFAWEAPALLPGACGVRVRPPGWETVLALETAREDVRLVVPAPGLIDVRAVAADTGGPVDGAELGWKVAGMRGFPQLLQRVRAREPGRLVCAVPQGAVELYVRGEGFAPTRALVRVEGPLTNLTVALERAG